MVSIIDVTEKQSLLYSLAPFSDDVKALKRQSDLVDFTYSDLRLYGSALTRGGVKSILTGDTISGIPVFEHRLCEAHPRLLSKFEDKLDMDAEVDSAFLSEFCAVFLDTQRIPFRDSAPLLYHLDFVPCSAEHIPTALADIFSRIRRTEKEGGYLEGGIYDFCRKAAAVHMGIVRVYPYADGFSELAARVSMQYELVRAGYFPVDTGLSESEYNKLTADAVKTGDAEPFAKSLRAAVFKKLEFLTDAARREREV